ncbi:thioredoxin-disulfide reductase [Diplocloster agilis]|uniref:Thioredoxin reductase n=1 Tax=Diplocloster agilis TaxID=2850323 RepID=A0A949K730_9FIRM|nr:MULTISPECIES: thioredoxin-disulfide reductase [Lachnospiraceae]MBU9739041.1 thioredoxin-disulfide reductase [Diplocloster agilis]MBU9742593.1 thioredoxin-disulfide reductase [Diplocloster agilis]MCU6735795.1 thioredoxin-disulfide reductase [Suonthocola fibrivorans]SCJ82058.1 Thioredoxin reductase [uncultured Clostridium sp.]
MGHIYDLIIIGSGPAGLSAAIYAQRAKLDTLVVEKNYASGGQVLNTYEVDNYPGLKGINGFDMGTKFREHADELGAVFAEAEVRSLVDEGAVKKVITDQETYEAKAVIIATGARHRKLGVPGEEELSGMGVSYCATCDGAFFRGKTVAVAGGGDVAVEDAIFLARICKKVYVIHRRDELRAANILQQNLFELDNVEMVWDTVVDEIAGEQQVEKLKIHNKKTGEAGELAVDGIFIAVGILPNSDEFEHPVEMDESKYLIAGEEGLTNIPGVFAAGDVRTKMLRQIVTAVSDGANAVTSVQKYLLTLK